MGEFMGDSGANHGNDNANSVTMGGEQAGTEANAEAGTEAQIPGYETDVADVRSDDIIRQGKDEFPCFDVTQDEFNQNMQDGRRRLRWKNGSPAQKYMSGTKYNRPFYVRTTDSAGKTYVRKIK
jgi:hypothetical protein